MTTDTDTLREALEPFAKMGRMLDGPFAPALFKDDQPIGIGGAWRENGETRTITFGDLRRAAAALATLSKPEPAAVDTVAISREAFDFLKGVGPLDGCHFGDKHPSERGAFWWRKHLIASPVPSGGADRFAIVEKAIAARLKHAVDHEKGRAVNAAQLALAVCAALGAYPSPSEAISPPDAPTATELDERNEAMACAGCGTTKTVAFIKANSPTAFTCCPERKMIPVRDLWTNACPPDARAVVEACAKVADNFNSPRTANAIRAKADEIIAALSTATGDEAQGGVR